MNTNSKINHGIISITLYCAAFAVGCISAFMSSFGFGLISIFLVIIAFIVVAAVYCSKCQCREKCNHFFIGKLSIILSKRNNKPYNTFDYIVGLSPMLMLVVFQQFFLLHQPFLLISYWILLLAGAAEALVFVCSGCRNYKCKMCRNKIIVLKEENLKNKNF